MSTNLINFQDKKNSPQLLAFLQQFGDENFVRAEELNAFRDGINFLANSIDTNGFVVKKNHGFSGNNYVIEAFFKWMLNLESYSNVVPVTLNVPFSATGKTRGEVIVATTTNTFVRVASAESSTVTSFPDLPANTIELARYIVRDNSIDTPTVPVPVGNFVDKDYYTPQYYTGDAVIGTINMDQKRGVLVIGGTVSKLGGIQKNTLNYIIGQPFYVFNNTPNILELENLHGPSNVKFKFPNGKNFFLDPGQFAQFVLLYIGGVLIHHYVGSIYEVTERTGASIKFDRIATYGTPTTPITGNITFDFTNAKKGMIQQMFHQGAVAPTLPASAFVLNSSAYDTSHKNMIMFCFSEAGRVEVSYNSMM